MHKSFSIQLLTLTLIYASHYIVHFYRAMHVVLARYCYVSRPSVRPSVRPSMTLMYRSCTSSKLIIRIISLGSSLLGATTSAV